MIITTLTGVREYSEGDPVELHRDEDTGRLVIAAYTQGGRDGVAIDVADLLAWLKNGGQELCNGQ